MNKLPFLLLLVLLISCKANISELKETDQIRLNSLGYLPNAEKKATITAEGSNFQVINTKSQRIVFKGTLSEPYSQENLGQTVRYADFSEVTQPGTYVINVDSVGRSYEFSIDENAYKEAFVTSMRSFYLWRCGMAVEDDHNGIHHHAEACHLEDGWLDYVGQEGERRDGTGGWHDAGDYGKYTVNAGVSLGILFYAWDQFSDKLKDLSLAIPQTAPGMPDFLQELKWETDFILKMQYTDGSGRVSHKLTRKKFSAFIMPHEDLEKRYFTEWSSAATADFVAMMAMASRYFKPYDEDYAQKCLDAAIVSYKCLQENPEKMFIQGDFSTGGYQTRDADDRLWAAAEMWETTGEACYLADLESQISSLRIIVEENWDWGNVSNLGVYTYILSKREGRNADLVNVVKKEVIDGANTLVKKAQKDIYGRALETYYWGCNGMVARQAINLEVANRIAPNEEYTATSLGLIGHIFGNNFYGRSYVTGLGINPPMHPHDRRISDGTEAPWPGYLVGGGRSATDWVDDQNDYSRNEICINWQASLVYLLALGM